MNLNVAEILQGCRLFSAVGERGFQRLVAMARLARFTKGDMVFHEGDSCPGVYIVGEGLVRVYKIAPNGREHVLHMVGPGHTFAEVAAIGGFDCPAHAEALATTSCVLLPLNRFRQALDEDHDLCREMMTGLTLWVRHLVTIIEDVTLRDAAGRLARYLLESPSVEDAVVELPSLKRHLASHLNLTSETLSRTLRRLAEAGMIVEEDPSRVRILDPSQLRKVAQGLFPEE